MDAQQFLAEFGHIANAPGGIAKLRLLVLQFAIQGRLISSLTTIESSDALLAEIRTIKSKLISDKKLSREKPFPKISRSEINAEIPPHWNLIRLGELWHLLSGRDG